MMMFMWHVLYGRGTAILTTLFLLLVVGFVAMVIWILR